MIEISRFVTDFGRLVLRAPEELEFVVWFFLKLLMSTLDYASLFLQNDRLQLRNHIKRPDEFREFPELATRATPPSTHPGVQSTRGCALPQRHAL